MKYSMLQKKIQYDKYRTPVLDRSSTKISNKITFKNLT